MPIGSAQPVVARDGSRRTVTDIFSVQFNLTLAFRSSPVVTAATGYKPAYSGGTRRLDTPRAHTEAQPPPHRSLTKYRLVSKFQQPASFANNHLIRSRGTMLLCNTFCHMSLNLGEPGGSPSGAQAIRLYMRL